MKQSSIINHQSSMFCSANGAVHTPPCNSHRFSQSIRDLNGSRTIVDTTVTTQSKVSLLGETYGRGLRKLALFLAFILLPIVTWGGNETFTFPTSGSGTKGKSFSVTSTGTSNCGTIYYVSNSAETYASKYGLEATYLGVVFKPTQKCKLKINAGNDNSSDNKISLTIFSAADARLYKLFKDAVGADMGAYVLNNASDADKTWWKDYGKVLKISSKKIVVDDSNYAKYLSGQTANTNLRTQIFTMSLPAKGTKSGGTCETTIVNGETEYEFNANTEYCIYAHRGSSKIGFLSFTFVPVATTYTATLDANGGTVNPTSVTQTSVGASITLPTPTLTGHSCEGWYTAKTGGTKRADADGLYTPTASETLYAHWTPIAYNITYTVDLKGQSNPNPTTYTIESDDITFTNLSDVTGYTFNGWNPTGIAKGSTGDKEITGSWTPKGTSYTVTYMDNDKELGSEEVVENGTPSSYANFQTKTGYTFDKWYNEATFDTEANMSAAITAAKSFYGKWNPNTNTAYKVKHYQQNIENDEYTLFETDELTGTTAENVTPDVKNYTGFTAPATQTKAIAADGSMVVEYQYTRNTYTLTWALDDGTITTAGTAAGPVKYGAPLTAPVVEKDGHIFSAWSPTVDATMPAEAKTYTALWEALYTVTFAAGEGGSGSMDPLSKVAGVEVTLPTCTFTAPAGKEFDKWISEDVTITNGKFTMPAKPVTVTAQWFVNPCNAIGYGTSVALANNASKGTLSITSVGGTWETGKTPFNGAESSNWFVSNGASNYMTGSLNDKYIQSITVSVSSSKSDKLKSAIVFSSAKNFDATKLVSYDGTNNVHLFNSKHTSSERATVEITAPVGAKSFAVGRNFSADFGSVDGEYQSSGSRYIYYVYACTAEEYTMSFDANGGGGTMESVSYPAGMKFTIPACTFTAPTGKDFDGWFDGTTTYAAGAEYTMGAKPVTLTAQWATKYTVTYMDGSTTLGIEKVEENAQNAEYINYQNRPLTTFQGWYSDQSLETAVTMPVTVTADVTYYGKWEKQYATSVDFMAEAVKSSPQSISTFLDTYHYAMSSLDNVSWDNNPYGNVDCGLKVENVSRTLSFWVEAGKKVSIQVGTMNGEYNGDNNVLLSINGVAQTPIAQKNASNPYIYTTTQETEFCLTTRDRPSGYTANVTWNLFQKITITDNKFNVTYNGNGNTGGEAPVDSNNPHIGGTSVTVLGNASLEKTGYTFNCWNTKSDGSGDDLSAKEPYGTFTIIKDTILYAKWTPVTYNIIYMDQNDAEYSGSNLTSLPTQHTYGTETALVNGVKENHDFVGWYTDAACTENKVTSLGETAYTAAITLYAKWQTAAATHNISYAETKDADMSAYPAQYTEGIGVESFAALSDLDDYKFNGWNPVSIPASATTDQTITATWKNKHNVSYDANGGSGSMDSQKGVHGEEFTLPACTFTAPEYMEFDVWTSDDVTITDNKFTMPDKNVTIKATWKEKVLPYAQSINLEQFVIDHTKKGDFQTYLSDNNYSYSLTTDAEKNNDELDSLASGKTKSNYEYLGLKLKHNGSYVSALVKGKKLVNIVIGNLGSAKVVIGTDTAKALVAGVASDSLPGNNYYYSSTMKTYKLLSKSTGTTVLKKIIITDPFVVTYNANGGSAKESDTFIGDTLTLPNATKDLSIFLGWYDAETAGTRVGGAGDKYVPASSTTLYAHWQYTGNIVTLSELKYGATPESATSIYEPDKTSFVVELPFGTTTVPNVYATPTISGATVLEAKATSLPGTTTITVTGTDGTTTQDYTVAFSVVECVGPTINTHPSADEANYGTGDEATALTIVATPGNEQKALSYQWYSNTENSYNGATLISGATEASYTPSTAVVGTMYYYCLVSEEECSLTAKSNFSGAIIIHKQLTAMSANQLFQVADMIPEGSSGAYASGLSENAFFVVIGDAAQGKEAAGTPEMKTDDKKTIDDTDLTGVMYFKGAANIVDNIPTSRALKMKFSTVGVLSVYGTGDLRLIKEGSSAPFTIGTEGAKEEDQKFEVRVKEGTYYMYATEGSRSLRGIKFTPVTPSNVATLDALNVIGGNMIPAFSTNVTTYTVYLALGKATDPQVNYQTTHQGATVVPSTSGNVTTLTVTAEDEVSQKNYQLTMYETDRLSYSIFDGAMMDTILPSPQESVLQWTIGSNVNKSTSDIAGNWNGKVYNKVVKGFKANTSTNEFSIVVPKGYQADFTIVGTTNSSGSERSIFISKTPTSTLQKDIAYCTSSTYTAVGAKSARVGAGTYYVGTTDSYRLFELTVDLYKLQNCTTDVTITTVSESDFVVKDKATITFAAQNGAVNSLYVEGGGKVKVENNLSVIKNFGIAAQSGVKSGQLQGGENLNITGNVYFDLTLDETAVSQGWYAFTVPFPVSSTQGVYNAANNTKLINEEDYAIMQFQGDVRATGQYGWIKTHKKGGMLYPGTLYIISLGDTEYNHLRFYKTVAGALISSNEVAVHKYQASGDDETAKDAGWNGVGNPTMRYSNASIEGVTKAQFLNHDNNAFEVSSSEITDESYIVGSAFFVQSPSDQTMTMIATDDPGSLRAPRRESATESEFLVRLGKTTSDFVDQLYVSATEDALPTYQIGHDLVKLSMGNATVPQMSVLAYNNLSLCDAEFPLENNMAVFPLTITAPAAGTYQLYVERAQENTSLLLMQNGQVIWDLTQSAYEINLIKGNNNQYSLKLQANERQIGTGCDSLYETNADGVQKFVLDNELRIVKSGRMYNAQGALLK